MTDGEDYDPSKENNCKLCTRKDDWDNLIECSGCNHWFHYKCLKITEVPEKSEPIYCNECINEEAEKTILEKGSDEKRETTGAVGEERGQLDLLELQRKKEMYEIELKYINAKMKQASISSKGAVPKLTRKHDSIAAYHQSMQHNNYLPRTLSRDQIAARQSMDKIKLPIFDGKPEDWLRFICNFEHSTAACGYSNVENMSRLSESLKGRALKHVRSCLSSPDMIPAAIETLRMLYGRPELIISKIKNTIMKTPPIKGIQQCIEFALKVQHLCTAIESAKIPEYLYDYSLIQDIVDKLPDNLKLQWAIHTEDKSAASVSAFSIWLMNIARLSSKVVLYEDKGESKFQTRGRNFVSGSAHMHTTDNSKSHQVQTQQVQNYKCPLCNDNEHDLQNCNTFIKKSKNDRWQVVREHKLCRSCLSRHNTRFCKKMKECGVDQCSRKHHQLLHNKDSPTPNQSEPSSKMVLMQENILAAHVQSPNRILYKVIPIKIFGKKGVCIETLAFIDEGASISIIEQELANQLGITGPKEKLRLNWTGGMFRMEPESEKINFEISGLNNESRFEVQARTISKLQLPAQYLDNTSRFDHLKDLDIHHYQKSRPQILLGLDNYYIVLPLESRKGTNEEPMAVKTRIGWAVFGKVPSSEKDHDAYLTHTAFDIQEDSSQSNQDLHKLVKNFFTVESFGVRSSKTPISKEDQRALDIMERTTKRTEGRFETGLLWSEDNPVFPNNFQMALKRMVAFENKMSKDPTMQKYVHQKMEEYMEKGYIRKLQKDELRRTAKTWYLPIFTVQNQNKEGKYRIVWDAAAKYNGISFNSKMIKGPDLISPLPEILNRFREGRFAISGDITEMYHQIRVKNSDKDSQRFLFRKDPTKQPEIYQMQVLTFGSACSPSSAIFTMNKNAEEHIKESPRAVIAITKNHYMDDWLDSCSNEEDLLQLANKVKEIHSKGGFTIGKWLSNSKLVTRTLHQNEPTHMKNIGQTNDKVLGIWWNTLTDTINFSINAHKFNESLLKGKEVPTKRQFLRALMSIFDPLGILAYIIIYGKIILQEIWRTKIDWDERIEKKQFDKWLQWIKVLREVNKLQIPRAYTFFNTTTAAELHVFSDASENAFSAVAYWRCTQENRTEIALIGAKTRVAPTKTLSIPRLELQGAVLATRFASFIEKSHNIQVTRRYFWCDSTNVLSWIRSDTRQYKQFVAVRIGEILDNSEVSEWKYVPSKENVADDATKWQNIPILSAEHRWFKGPEFLYESESEWPTQREHVQDNTNEMKAHLMHVTSQKKSCLVEWQRFSKYIRLINATAYVLRAVQVFKRVRKTEIQALPIKNDKISPITSMEFKLAEETLIRKCQEEEFSEEIANLRFSNINELKSSSIYKMSPYLDEHGIIRSKGRIEMAKVDFNTRNPIILPSNHAFSILLATSYHEKYLHKNFETVVNEIRRRYEIPRIRPLLKTIRRNCMMCKIIYANPKPTIMSPLPATRLAAYERPFSHVGLDFFGPFYVQIGRRNEKRWGMLVTCMTIRAIHLEVAETLSTDSCIMALRRTFAIRGTPKTITSDQGTNFRGASRELDESIKRIKQHELKSFFHQSEWKFIPPHSPHMGGVWERLVRTVKSNLSEILANRKLTEEVLRTAFHEVTQIVNTRPLTEVPVESHNQPAITPNDLLSIPGIMEKPPGTIEEPERVINIRLSKSWKMTQLLANNFWKRWVAEYLPTLRRKTKWFDATKPIEINDVVILCDENLPRCSWPKGVVIDINRSHDGVIRSAVVRTSNHGNIVTYTRPITKLAILDLGKSTHGNTVNLPGGTVMYTQFGTKNKNFSERGAHSF